MQGSTEQAEKDKRFAAYIAGSIADSEWIAPSLYVEAEPVGEERRLVIYGQDLIAHTARYFGPQGTMSKKLTE